MRFRIIFLVLIIFTNFNINSDDKLKSFSADEKIISIIEEEKVNAFKTLLKKYDINAADENGKSLLMYAASNNKINIIKLLLGKGVNINAQDKEGNTVLSYALINDNDEVAIFLINKGININLSSKNKPIFILACKIIS